MREHIGVEVPLALIAGDPRTTPSRDGVYLSGFFNTAAAFEELVCDVAEGRDPLAARLQFARDVHYAEHYATAHAINDTILAAEPRHAEALALRGDIQVHEERFAEALATARQALAIDGDSRDATIVLADAFEGLRQWGDLLAVADRLIGSAADRFEARHAIRSRAIALAGQGRYDEANLAVEEYAASFPRPEMFRRALREQIDRLKAKRNEAIP